jgi:hypothetical protein
VHPGSEAEQVGATEAGWLLYVERLLVAQVDPQLAAGGSPAGVSGDLYGAACWGIVQALQVDHELVLVVGGHWVCGRSERH